jgi:hydroxyacylglutathione hydrolase
MHCLLGNSSDYILPIMIEINPIPAFQDNYIWQLVDTGHKSCLVVDPGDARPVLARLKQQGLRLAAILITHHHADHTGGISTLLQQHPVPVYGPASEAINGITHPLKEGDRIQALGCSFQILELPGHTLGHIAYFSENFTAQPILFCGDTLFAGGCGRLFEGTPLQMHESLQKLAALPGNTGVYCTHEYTESNLHFALQVEPGNTQLRARLEKVQRLRAGGRCTLPSSIADELATNPFLRTRHAAVIAAAEQRTPQRHPPPEEVFRIIRNWKDQS